MNAKRLTQDELERLEIAVADGKFTHNLPTVLRLLATVRHLQARLYHDSNYDGATFIPFEGTVK